MPFMFFSSEMMTEFMGKKIKKQKYFVAPFPRNLVSLPVIN